MHSTARQPRATKVVNDVPFYGNTPDDVHCTQATLKSVRKFFEPEREFDWKELDAATGNTGRGVWRMKGILWMREAGYQVHDIEALNYSEFARRGLDYLAEHHSPEFAAWEASQFDIPAEQERAKSFVKQVGVDARIPNQADIELFLRDGYLVQVTVNIYKLHNLPGYRGHAILVIGYDAESFTIHDPGLPPRANYKISRQDFESAWASPGERSKVIAAMRLTGRAAPKPS